MTEVIKNGIVQGMKRIFDLPIYAEEVRQGARSPCFCVTMVHMEEIRLLNLRRERKVSFAIRYLEADIAEKREHTAKIMDKLYGALCFIGEAEMFAAGDMRHEMNDEGAVFFVDYKYHVVLDEAAYLMERLEHNGRKVVGYEEKEG